MANLLDKVMNLVGLNNSEEDYDEDDGINTKEENAEKEQYLFEADNKRHQKKVVNIHASLQFKVVVMKPQSFDEAQNICDHLKSKKPVIVNLEELEKESAQRLVDFLCGAVYALDGNIYKVSSSIFLITPQNVEVLGDFNNEIKSDNIFPWMQ